MYLWRPCSDNGKYHLSEEMRREEEEARRRLNENNEELHRSLREALLNRLRNPNATNDHESGESPESEEALVSRKNKRQERKSEESSSTSSDLADLNELQTTSSDEIALSIALREIPIHDDSESAELTSDSV